VHFEEGVTVNQLLEERDGLFQGGDSGFEVKGTVVEDLDLGSSCVIEGNNVIVQVR